VCSRSALNRYGVLDDPPLRIVVVGQICAKELAQYLGVAAIGPSLNEA
jgi:hypothetical protein